MQSTPVPTSPPKMAELNHANETPDFVINCFYARQCIVVNEIYQLLKSDDFAHEAEAFPLGLSARTRLLRRPRQRYPSKRRLRHQTLDPRSPQALAERYCLTIEEYKTGKKGELVRGR